MFYTGKILNLLDFAREKHVSRDSFGNNLRMEDVLTGEALAVTVFFLEILSLSEPILRAKIENMIWPDYVLCYILRANGNFRKILKKFWRFLKFLEIFEFFWKNFEL